MIYNTTFEVKLKKPLLESIESFFLKQEDKPLRYAIVEVKKKDKEKKAIIEATMIKRD